MGWVYDCDTPTRTISASPENQMKRFHGFPLPSTSTIENPHLLASQVAEYYEMTGHVDELSEAETKYIRQLPIP